MRTITALGFAAVATFSLLSLACDKLEEPLAVPVPPPVRPDPAPVRRVSTTEVTSATLPEAKVEEKATAPKAGAPAAPSEPGQEGAGD